VVRQSILSTDPIEGPLALPFRLGVAYPLRGEVRGEGVGSERIGEFSTGTAIERVTEWVPNQKLAFLLPYWLPVARWIVRQNNACVLEHIRSHAGRGAQT
jgi:hypothetical protein